MEGSNEGCVFKPATTVDGGSLIPLGKLWDQPKTLTLEVSYPKGEGAGVFIYRLPASH